MFQLRNAASAILRSAYAELLESEYGASEYGYRFQDIVIGGLRMHPLFAGDLLYDNRSNGQPDCYQGRDSWAFEVKCRNSTGLQLDANSWAALPKFKNPRVIAMLPAGSPYPLWVVDITGVVKGVIRLGESTKCDGNLERHLADAISDVVESVGRRRLVELDRTDLAELIKAVVSAAV